jgi:adenylate cyclase
MTRTRLVLAFTDIVGSTALAERLGDEGWLTLLRAHNALVRAEVRRHRGRELKFLGDGFMLAFEDEHDALDCAVAIQRRLTELGAPQLRVRIGVHSGRALPADGDVIGVDVALASRLTRLARGDEILISGAVRRAVGRARDALLGPGRTVAVHGLTTRHEVFPVAWNRWAGSPLTAALASVMVAP